MDRLWTKNDPTCLPAKVEQDQRGSRIYLLDMSFARHAEEGANILMDKALTYGEIDAKSCAASASLQSLSLKKGDRVAIMMPDVPQSPVVLAGVLRAGLIAVNLDPLNTSHELEHRLNDSGAKAKLIAENSVKTPEAGDPRMKIETALCDLLDVPKGGMTGAVLRHTRKAVLTSSQRPDVITADSFFKSGNIGRVDPQGFTPMGERKKEMTFVPGLNVYRKEIEGVAANLDEAPRVGVADKSSGTTVMVFATKANPDLTGKHMRDFCGTELGKCKKPGDRRGVKEVQKTNVGKILHRELCNAAVVEMTG